MKAFIVSMILFQGVAFAEITNVDIKKFNFNYSAPRGEGSADAFSYSRGGRAAQSVVVDKVGEEFNVKLTGVEEQEFTFKDAPSMVMDAQTMRIVNLNFALNSTLKFTMDQGKFVSTSENVDLKGFSLACNRIASNPDVLDQLITGCVQKMTLSSSQVETQGLAAAQAFVSALDDTFEPARDSVSVKNISFKSAAGKFELSADVRAQISGTAKGKGTLSYDLATKKLTIKVNEVKFGILNVTSQVFDQLKQNETENMKVQRPYIYLTIK